MRKPVEELTNDELIVEIENYIMQEILFNRRAQIMAEALDRIKKLTLNGVEPETSSNENF